MATTTKTRKAAPKSKGTYRKAGSEAIEVNWHEFIKEMLDPAIPAHIGSTYSAFKAGSEGHGYSPLNQFWLTWQAIIEERTTGKKPVLPVGPYGAWKHFDRHVVKGAKAKTVLAPVFIWKKETDETGKERKVKIGPVNYKVIKTAFFYSDTDGAPLELGPVSEDWTLERALEVLDIQQVSYDLADGNTQGYSTGRKFALNPVAAHPYKTLFHELGHIVLGHTSAEQVGDYQSHRGIKEFQAEAVAYLLAHELDLTDWDASESRAYVRGWLSGGEVSDKDIRQVFGAVSKILNAGRSKAEEEGEGEVAA